MSLVPAVLPQLVAQLRRDWCAPRGTSDLGQLRSISSDNDRDSKTGNASIVTKKKKWQTSLDSQPKVELHLLATGELKPAKICALAASPHGRLPLKAIERSNSGAEGVFFVRMERSGDDENDVDTVLVVKRSLTLGAEVIAQLLALRMGIAGPELGVLDIARGDAGAAFCDLIQRPAIDPSGRAFFTLANIKAALLVELVRGKSLRDLGLSGSARLFFGKSVRDVGGGGVSLTPAGRRLCEQIGAIIALDVICNNGDRIPIGTVWQNEGNLGNIMLTDECAVAIDSKITPLLGGTDNRDIPASQRAQRTAYFASVRQLFASVIRRNSADAAESKRECLEFRVAQDALSLCLGVDVGLEGMECIRTGFIDAIERAASIDVAEVEDWIRLLSRADLAAVADTIPAETVSWLRDMFELCKHPLPKASNPISALFGISSASNDAAAASQDAAEAIPHSAPRFKSRARSVGCSWKRIIDQKGTVPSFARRYATAFSVAHEESMQMWIFGGILPSGQAVNELLCWNMATHTWSDVSTSGESPCPRFAHSTALLHRADGSLAAYTFGGRPDLRGPGLQDTWKLDIATRTWTPLTTESAPSPRFHHAILLDPSAKPTWFVVFGGNSVDGMTYCSDAWLFDGVAEQWWLLADDNLEHAPGHRAGAVVLPLSMPKDIAVDQDARVLKVPFLSCGGCRGIDGEELMLDNWAASIEVTFNLDGAVSAVAPLRWHGDTAVGGQLIRTGRPLSGQPIHTDLQRGFAFVFGGFDGKHPLHDLTVFDIKAMSWITSELWLELGSILSQAAASTGADDNNAPKSAAIVAAAVGSEGTKPTSRYGHVSVLSPVRPSPIKINGEDDYGGILTVYGGSGMKYLNDVFEIDTLQDDDE